MAQKEHNTVYEARFADGTVITKTERQGYTNRLQVYNWVCETRISKTHGALIEITCRTI